MAWRAQLGKNLKEIRILFCQTSPASSQAKGFVEKNYTELKTLNPKLPIMIREACGAGPQLWARYDFGVEQDGLNEGERSKVLENLLELGKIKKVEWHLY